MKKLATRYFSPAADTIEGWETYSIPMGNGFIGANIFGRTDRERIQVTQNSFVASPGQGGLTDFAELYLDLGHDEVTEYERVWISITPFPMYTMCATASPMTESISSPIPTALWLSD